MAENESKKLSEFASNEELVEFLDTHNIGGYELEEHTLTI